MNKPFIVRLYGELNNKRVSVVPVDRSNLLAQTLGMAKCTNSMMRSLGILIYLKDSEGVLEHFLKKEGDNFLALELVVDNNGCIKSVQKAIAADLFS